MSFGDHSADYSSILVLSYVLASEFKQFNLDNCRQVHLKSAFQHKTIKKQEGLGQALTSKMSVALGGIFGGLPAEP